MRILIVGHACSPRYGSEHAFTWNWAWHLSARHQVWVITHPYDRGEIESFLRIHPNANLRFHWVTPPAWCDPWDPSSKRGLFFHYVLWQRYALWTAAQLHRQLGFHLAHHVSWGTVSRPPLLWRLPIPFVWGPVGGGQVAPRAFRRYFASWWKREALRTISVRLAAHRPLLRKAVRRSALILTTNSETVQVLQRAGAQDVRMFLDSGVAPRFINEQVPRREPKARLRLIWVGSLEPRKCLPLTLEALGQVKDQPLDLLVAGEGPFRRQWEMLAGELGLRDRVWFLGSVPHEEMPALYRSADMFIFSSLRDSFGGATLEAMAAGLPVIALDHQGVGTFVPAEAGIKVPVTSPEQTVAGLADAMRRLAASQELRTRMGMAGWEFAKTQTWDHRAEIMSAWYEQVVGDCRRLPIEPLKIPA